MKSIISLDALTWLGGLAAQTFLKALFVLLLLNGLIDLFLIRNLDSGSSKYILGGGLAACVFLAWVFLLWKTEPPILPRNLLGALPLLIGIGAFLVTGNWIWWLIVIFGYVRGLSGWFISVLRLYERQCNSGRREMLSKLFRCLIDT